MGFRLSVVLVLSACGITTGYSGGLDFPFERTSNRQVCQGYNTPTITHHNARSIKREYALDLAFGNPHVVGNTGCAGNEDATIGQEFLAPAAGEIVNIYGSQQDISCLKLDQFVLGQNGVRINSLELGHFFNTTKDANRKRKGSRVAKGEKVGTGSRWARRRQFYLSHDTFRSSGF